MKKNTDTLLIIFLIIFLKRRIYLPLCVSVNKLIHAMLFSPSILLIIPLPIRNEFYRCEVIRSANLPQCEFSGGYQYVV